MAPPNNAPKVDLIIVFRNSTNPLSKLKSELLSNAKEAADEYARLLQTLRDAGLKATGRRGEKNGELLVLIWAPETKLLGLVTRERHSDFLRGLPISQLPSLAGGFTVSKLTPADRLRLIHEYVTSTPADGGLGILPGSKDWSHVQSVMALHDHEFNDMWIRAWTSRQMGFGIGTRELDKIRDQFGEAVALYFSFLSSYTRCLLFLAPLGLAFYALKLPYSAAYSSLLLLWSVSFVEFWRLNERRLSVRWGTRGSFRVEKRRAQFSDVVGGGKFPWWKRDVRILSSVPIILAFAALLAVLLTGIFVFEAFVTQLYTGPGHQYVSFSPTILFVALVPRLLAVYQSYAVRLTHWENHSRQSSHEGSLAMKTFALSAVVAYLGLALSAFVYIPFGEAFMTYVQTQVFAGTSFLNATMPFKPNETTGGVKGGIWEASAGNARSKINPSRLQNQMFAYTVTNQAINMFLEIGLPFITRKVDTLRSGKSHKPGNGNSGTGSPNGSKKKRVVFDDEETGEKEEREFLELVRHEAALPEYTLFGDYAEMVTQFGYIALWSTIWPLAPVMALLNNWVELRSDAFKIAQHWRRPIPTRTDTIGPWLDSLGFLTWLAALTNSSLVYLFRSRDRSAPFSTAMQTNHPHTAIPLNSTLLQSVASPQAYTSLIVPALVIALASSHGYFVVRAIVRHILVRLVWKGSKEEAQEEQADMQVKDQFLRSLGLDKVEDKSGVPADVDLKAHDATGFWTRDEGMDDIQKVIKEA